VICRPSEQFPQRSILTGLRRQCRAELCLSRRASQENNHHLRHAKSQRRTQVLFHQGKREVNTGRHPRRGVELLVPHVDRIGINLDPWMCACQFAAPIPVRGGLAPVEETGIGQDECAGANRTAEPFCFALSARQEIWASSASRGRPILLLRAACRWARSFSQKCNRR